uniref:Uncharacterized protein n=1 Tax=Myoviridae sp. ctgEf1 TaxID=2827699 RepID=A0A8S5SM12_9CAUD|nr:MAG TPA: hypothetical protein [Myoviridae sp. ctgEf1]
MRFSTFVLLPFGNSASPPIRGLQSVSSPTRDD